MPVLGRMGCEQGGCNGVPMGSGSGSENEESPSPWIEWFLSQPEHDFFVEIEEEYILDRFNLTGLPMSVPHFQKALDRITQEEEYEDSDSSCTEDENSVERKKSAYVSTKEKQSMQEQIHASAIHLYGLIHARYITTGPGMARMYEKWKEGSFGACPRVFCRGFSLLPVGISDVPEKSSVLLFCANCEDIYRPRNVDGAYFGASFPHLFMQQYKACRPNPKITDHYVPKIFGFMLYAPPAAHPNHQQNNDAEMKTVAVAE